MAGADLWRADDNGASLQDFGNKRRVEESHLISMSGCIVHTVCSVAYVLWVGVFMSMEESPELEQQRMREFIFPHRQSLFIQCHHKKTRGTLMRLI